MCMDEIIAHECNKIKVKDRRLYEGTILRKFWTFSLFYICTLFNVLIMTMTLFLFFMYLFTDNAKTQMRLLPFNEGTGAKFLSNMFFKKKKNKKKKKQQSKFTFSSRLKSQLILLFNLFLILLMGPTVLFHLTFTFIYSTISKKISVSAK